jgi:hypothetical protein
VRSTALMCGRTHSSWAFRDLFLGHISPISPHFPIRPYSKPRALSPLPHLNHSLTSKIPQPTATNLLPHHRNTTAGLSPVNPPTAGRPFGQLLIFPPFSTRNPLFQVCSFFFHFFLWIYGTSPFWDCAALFGVGFLVFLQGVGLF